VSSFFGSFFFCATDQEEDVRRSKQVNVM